MGALLVTGIIQYVEAWPQLLETYFSAKLFPWLFKYKTKPNQTKILWNYYKGKADGLEIPL